MISAVTGDGYMLIWHSVPGDWKPRLRRSPKLRCDVAAYLSLGEPYIARDVGPRQVRIFVRNSDVYRPVFVEFEIY